VKLHKKKLKIYMSEEGLELMHFEELVMVPPRKMPKLLKGGIMS